MPRKEHEHDRIRGLDKDARDSAHYRKVLKIDAEDDSKPSQVGSRPLLLCRWIMRETIEKRWHSNSELFTIQNLLRSKQRKGILQKSLESTYSKAWTFRNRCGIVLAMEVIV